MDKAKTQGKLDVVYDTLFRIHTDLCDEYKFEEADMCYDIMRRLMLFANKLGDKNV